jgi:hypothetical protein
LCSKCERFDAGNKGDEHIEANLNTFYLRRFCELATATKHFVGTGKANITNVTYFS